MKQNKRPEYLAGIRACKGGALCPEGASRDYMAGYGYQYEVEAKQDAKK